MLLRVLIHVVSVFLVTSEVLEAKTDRASFAFHLSQRPVDQAATRHHWLITTTLQGKVIRVNVVDVNLGPDCRVISLRVLDGADGNAKQIGAVCGTQKANFTSSGTAVLLELVQPVGEAACPDCFLSVTYWAKYPDTSLVAVIAPPFAGTLLLTLAIVCFIRCRERRNRASGGLPDSMQSSPATLINVERDNPPTYDDCFPDGSPYDPHVNRAFEGDGESGQGGRGGNDGDNNDNHADLESLPPSYGSVQRKYKAELTRRGFFFHLLSTITGLAPVPERPGQNQTLPVDVPTEANTIEADPNAGKTVTIQVEERNTESTLPALDPEVDRSIPAVAVIEREDDPKDAVAGNEANQVRGENSDGTAESRDTGAYGENAAVSTDVGDEVCCDPVLNTCDSDTRL